MPPKRVLLTFLNTGGGHRSTALAVAEALEDLYGGQVRVGLVDVTAEYFPWPLCELNRVYNWLVRLNGWPWAFVYHLTNAPRRLSVLRSGWWLLTGESTLDLLDDHAADVVVCCHPLLKAPLAQAVRLRGCQTPLITLVTDLASGHAAWFYPSSGECLVPTEQAQKRALACGVRADSVHVIGLPVRPCFVRTAEEDRALTRRELGLEADEPVVLLLSGADGVGPFYALLEAVLADGIGAQLVAIIGRNERLRARLASKHWPAPLRVEGFVENIHEWMHAADLVVTKAGPSTITEALAVGTPMVISGAVPGQEPPNVPHVVETGAGVWAPHPSQAAEVVQELLSDSGEKLRHMTNCACEAGRPRAAWRVAEAVWARAQR